MQLGMSAMGQKRTHALQQTAPLFNHLVGGRKQLRVEFKAERLGRLQIDHEFKFAGLNDRQIGRLLALENPAGIIAR